MWIPLEIMWEMFISVRSLEPSWMLVRPREWVNGCRSSFWFSQFQSSQRSSDRSRNQNAFGEMSPWVVSVFEANENIFRVSRRPALSEPLPEQRLPAGRLWMNSVSWELRWSISLTSTATVTPLPQPVWIPPWNEVRAGGTISLVPGFNFGPHSFWGNSQTQARTQAGNACPDQASLGRPGRRALLTDQWAVDFTVDEVPDEERFRWADTIVLSLYLPLSSPGDHVLYLTFLQVPRPVPKA